MATMYCCLSCSNSSNSKNISGSVIEKKVTKQKNLSKAKAEQAIAYHLSIRKETLKKENQKAWSQKEINVGSLRMKFLFKEFGKAPQGGHSLYISMHGGGGTEASVNDQQWENQIKLYKPKEGIYLAPRAPLDAWNMWHVAIIDTLMDKLIECCEVFQDINPNKVYIMGYSAGGDGCYQLAPRLAERWAAASMMAGHPGNAKAENLRNVPFSLWVGELDKAYHRNTFVPIWNDELNFLQINDSLGYIHDAHVVKGDAHWMNHKDTLAVPWMAKYTRNPYPKRIVWIQDDVLRTTRYWVELPKEELKKEETVNVSYDKQTIIIDKCFTSKITFWLSDEMFNLDKPIEIVYKDKILYKGIVSRNQQDIKSRIDHFYNTGEKYSAKIEVKIIDS